MKIICGSLITILLIGAAFGQRHPKKAETVSVTIYEDGKQQSVMTFAGNLPVKEETSEVVNNRKIRNVTRYYYAKNGKISSTEKWKNGVKVSRRDRDYDFEVNLTAQYLYSVNLLEKKGIKVSLPGLIFSQLKDTAGVFETADKQDDFKREISTDGDFKTIKFIGFDKNIRFDPTLLDINMDQTITDYELTLKNGYPAKEIYKTGASELKEAKSAEIIREYTYENNRLTKLVTTSNIIRKQGEPYHSVTELKFVY